MSQGHRDTIIKAVKLFCLNNSKVSIQDDGEDFLIFINDKSVTFHLVSHEIDYYDPENIENFDFQLTITVWGEITLNHAELLTNDIRKFIKALSVEVSRVLTEKKEIEKAKKVENKSFLVSDESIESAFCDYQNWSVA